MHKNNAETVCLVPSWTETLLEAGVSVVGRTRFCIHPAEKTDAIPAVGGTKSFKLDEILALKPSYVILDKEENKKEMADSLEEAGVKILVSHVHDTTSASEFLELLAKTYSNVTLQDYADLYRVLRENRRLLSKEKFYDKAVLRSNAAIEEDNLEYVIWKNPYMVIGAPTFIADIFGLFDLKLRRPEKYPEIAEVELRRRFCLFSSEPYPFGREFTALTEEGYKGAVIDGEKISWYGVRNLRFLESCLE